MSGNGFAKLDGGIVDSTLWMHPHDVLRVWIAMLAKSDSYGIVRASVPAFAHLCLMPIERLEQILAILTSPDPYSRTPDDDGKRLRVIEGGWLILNYVKYRELVQTKAQSHAERQRKYRERIKERDEKITGDGRVTLEVTSDPEAEAEAEEEAKEKKEITNPVGLIVPGKPGTPPPSSTPSPSSPTNAKAERLAQVTQDAIDAFNAVLGKPNGQLARVHLPNEVRQDQVKRCLSVARQICEKVYGSPTVTPQFWVEYWDECDKDPFKRGDGPYTGSHANWRPSFKYLTRKDVMADAFDKAMSEQAMSEQVTICPSSQRLSSKQNVLLAYAKQVEDSNVAD